MKLVKCLACGARLRASTTNKLHRRLREHGARCCWSFKPVRGMGSSSFTLHRG